MKVSFLLKQTIGILAIGGLAIAVPAMAQNDTGQPSASDSMHQAGNSMKQAGSETVNAAKHAAEGTATAMRDTKITAKVKAALHHAGISEKSEIHVNTTAGVVDLSGRVPSTDMAEQAVQLAKQTEGVRSVTNDLRVAETVQPD